MIIWLKIEKSGCKYNCIFWAGGPKFIAKNVGPAAEKNFFPKCAQTKAKALPKRKGFCQEKCA
jgi:hypothetical protein